MHDSGKALKIYVRLTPRASSDRIGEKQILLDGAEQLSIYVTAIPEKGKANESMIRLLAKHFNVPVSSIDIIKGATSRNKMIKVNIKNAIEDY